MENKIKNTITIGASHAFEIMMSILRINSVFPLCNLNPMGLLPAMQFCLLTGSIGM